MGYAQHQVGFGILSQDWADLTSLGDAYPSRKPPSQLLKWVGNKQRFAPAITRSIPLDINTYIEPFLGSGAILGALWPARGLAGDALEPLIGIWQLLKESPDELVASYAERRKRYMEAPADTYAAVKDAYNQNPNALDLLFISRSCYGGVVRFTKAGTISTPIGPHTPIPTAKFKQRVVEWHERVKHTAFLCADFAETMSQASKGDVVYCDPPYVYTQAILYGAQDFRLERLWEAIEGCARRGALVLLSIDGTKKSGSQELNIQPPDGLFKREILIDCGRSMLRRFQRGGETLEDEVVHDRLMLTW
jgi:DNA adenine methylase